MPTFPKYFWHAYVIHMASMHTSQANSDKITGSHFQVVNTQFANENIQKGFSLHNSMPNCNENLGGGGGGGGVRGGLNKKPSFIPTHSGTKQWPEVSQKLHFILVLHSSNKNKINPNN